MYIRIKKCESKTAWYKNKIGLTFKICEDAEFPNQHMIKINHNKKKAQYGMVNHEDSEIITPDIIDKLKHFLRYNI